MRHDLCSDQMLCASSNSLLPVAITQIADDSIRKAAGLLFAVCKIFTRIKTTFFARSVAICPVRT